MRFQLVLFAIAKAMLTTVTSGTPIVTGATPASIPGAPEQKGPRAVVFQYQYTQKEGKYYTFLTMDELRSKPSYYQATCYTSYNPDFQMLEFYPDRGSDENSLACRAFDNKGCDTTGHHTTFIYRKDADCYHDLNTCHQGNFYWAKKIASMKCWKPTHGFPPGAVDSTTDVSRDVLAM